MKRRSFLLLPLAAALLIGSAPADSQAPAELTYADLADIGLAAPVAAHVRVAESVALKRERAAGVAPGKARFYVEGDVVSLVRGADALPTRVRWLVDLPRDSKGRAPKLRKGTDLIVLASADPARPGELRLVAPDAQLPFTPERMERLRAILREATSANRPPRITGIGRAFHVPGAVPGESETQIFLQTAEGRPVSLSVLRRPGETPQWAVSLSEIVDESATTPQRDTLLWYRLACSLPRALPSQSFADAEGGSAAAIEADYRLILERLGPCTRSRAPR